LQPRRARIRVEFSERAVIVTVALRRQQRFCSGCGAGGLAIKDHRVKRWRHLDLGGVRCVIECKLRRLYCPDCGDLPEAVEWARGGSRYTRDFEDLVAWLAQQMSQTQVTRLMRIAWETVGNILQRVVASKLDRGRLDGLQFIGVDGVSYGADHKFLTCVADHDQAAIVWAAEGRNAASLQAFFDGLTSEQKASVKAVSIDMSAGYENAIRSQHGVPHAQVCFDPFHVCQLGSKAVDQVRRDEYNQHGRSASSEGKWIKGTRYSLLKDTAKQSAGQLVRLAEVVLTNKRMYRAFLLYGELRYIYRLPKPEAAERLDAWLAWAARSRLKPFVKLARTIRQHKQQPDQPRAAAGPPTAKRRQRRGEERGRLTSAPRRVNADPTPRRLRRPAGESRADHPDIHSAASMPLDPQPSTSPDAPTGARPLPHSPPNDEESPKPEFRSW